MAKASSQKFIARNRAPRVQIEYDVETYGSEKKVQLPFVVGVMSDLSGKPTEPLPPIVDRKMLEIDIDNFDDRLKSMKPRVAFTVPNTLTGEGNLAVDITFKSMDDFSPAAVARNVEALNKLLEARTQLSNLMTYMDGKTGRRRACRQVAARPGLDGQPGRRAEAGRRLRRRWGGIACPGPNFPPAPPPGLVETTTGNSDFASLLNREFKPKSDRAREAVESAIHTLATQALASTSLISNDALRSIESMIAAIDAKLSEQVNAIMHHEDFQQLESAWRGLSYLVNNTETDETLKIKVLNVSKKGSRPLAEEIPWHGVGPEPGLQENLRGGVRSVRWRAIRPAVRRLLFRPQPGGHAIAGRHRAGGCRGPRTVHRRGQPDRAAARDLG